MSYVTVEYLSQRLDDSRESATSWGSTWFALPLRSRRDQPRPNRCRTVYFLSATPEGVNAFSGLHQVRDMRPLCLNSHSRCWLHEIDTMLQNLSCVRSGVPTKLLYNFHARQSSWAEKTHQHTWAIAFLKCLSVFIVSVLVLRFVCKNAIPVKVWSAPYSQNKLRFED